MTLVRARKAEEGSVGILAGPVLGSDGEARRELEIVNMALDEQEGMWLARGGVSGVGTGVGNNTNLNGTRLKVGESGEGGDHGGEGGGGADGNKTGEEDEGSILSAGFNYGPRLDLKSMAGAPGRLLRRNDMLLQRREDRLRQIEEKRQVRESLVWVDENIE